ncbi:Zinc finger protein [Plakobranchus ocellatus]|uniref:Zinc finger protein n=1 Tax=Plakobranchus ocellatus TaxID=259542 RepID=A0AAV4CYD1_9GAST|nr:Zinc finger protein [Plakobranchus ocellatus]
MSHNIVSLTDQSGSQNIRIPEASPYLGSDVKLVKNEENSQVFSQSLRDNLVTQVDDGFPENSGVALMESSNMIVSQNDGVMYIEADGSVIFKPKEITSSSSETMPISPRSRPDISLCLEDSSNIDQNYLVVVENPVASQALSTDFEASIVMNPESSGLDANSSLSASGTGVDLKSGGSEHPHQHTIMVLDSQIGADSMLIDPNVLVAYENSSTKQMSFNADPTLESNIRPIPEICQGSYMNLTEASIAGGVANYLCEKNVHQSSDLSTQFNNAQSVHTILIAPSKTSQSTEAKGLDHEKKSTGFKECESSRLLQQQENLKMLEKSHLHHHMKEAKKKLSSELKGYDSKSYAGKKGEESVDSMSYPEGDNTGSLSNVDDNTCVFSSITAKINADLLAHVPGCQRFLFEKMEQSPPSSQLHMTIKSQSDCIFSGTLKSFIEIHNGLKKSLDVKDVSLLEWKSTKKAENTCEQGTMCTLLQPFISLRGRQPKYSYKAKAMDFTSDFESLLNIDNVDDFDERPPPISSRKKKKKRCKSRKPIMSNKSPNSRNSQESQFDKQCLQHSSQEEQIKGIDCNIQSQLSASFDDPLQQKLLEEQRKYRKRLESNTKKLYSAGSESDVIDKTGLSQEKIYRGTEGHEIQRSLSSDVCKSVASTRRRRDYSSRQYEKVQPRNPLTESESTKQLRVYEENLAFKFFCKYCSFKTKRHSHFLIHMRCHKDGTEKTYSCKTCDFVTLSLSYLKRHELKHKENLFSCNICAAYQTDKESFLQRHIRIKHSSNPKAGMDCSLQCGQCGFHTSDDKDLAQHKLAHSRLDSQSNKTIHSCPECKRTLRSKMHLHRHIRDVHGPDIRPHLCDKCGKAFKRRDALRQHKALHESKANRNLPHKCTTCGKAFRSMAHLKEHLVIHTSERPYLCQYCGAAFKTQAVQKRHILTLHIKPRAHVCSVCSRQFNAKHALQRHESTHVKNESTQESAVMVVDSIEGINEKEKRMAISNLETHVASVSGTLKVEDEDNSHISTGNQVSTVLVQDIIGTASAQSVMEDQMGPENQRLPHAYMQSTQDATTLYYFTGDLQSL